MTIPAVSLHQVNKSFGTGALRTQVLFDIDLSLPPGELALVVGPSGCGKTTLISIIVGILLSDSGRVDVFGHALDRMSDAEKTAFRKNHIGFIFQQFNLVPTLTARENVAVPLLIQGMSRKRAFEKADEVLNIVDMGDRLTYLPRDLSGGQQQRVAIARALAVEPKLIVCDEPTASLDAQTGKKVMDMLKSIATRPDRLVIVVTHDNRIFDYGDRLVEMNDGRIVATRILSPSLKEHH